jgi:RNA polymerase sigma-70 factor (ECF subfamily)
MQDIDINIIKGCMAKDARAEYALYTACFQTLMSIAYRYTRNEDDAADLANKGFLKIITNLIYFLENLKFIFNTQCIENKIM